MPEEIEKMCAAGPPLLKEWGLVFAGKTLAIKDSVAFIAMDKGLNQSSPTEDAIMIVLVALKVVITAEFPNLTQLPDPRATDGDDAVKQVRAMSKSAVNMLHMLAWEQKPYTVQTALSAAGLGDVNARDEAEVRNKKEKAGAHASTMRGDCAAIYHLVLDPRTYCKAETYGKVREALICATSRRVCPSWGRRSWRACRRWTRNSSCRWPRGATGR